MEIFKIGAPLVQWFHLNKREMPWREDPTPYHVLVSEMMLQQTRVDTVRSYYQRFIEILPDFQALANCPEEKLLKLWEGLGYYNRVRNLQKTAQTLEGEYQGELPEDYEKLLALPGIGSYTAGAILSIAYHKPYPVVDGNVLRVLSRVLESEQDISEDKTKKAFETELKKVLETGNIEPSDFNQALMELGALICTPQNPTCGECPLKELCKAKAKGREKELPIKKKKIKKVIEKKTVLLLYKDGKICLEKREEKNVLSGMYGLPLLEGEWTPEAVQEKLQESGFTIETIEKEVHKKHVFTHKVWEMDCYRICLKEGVPERNQRFVTLEELENQYALGSAFKYWKF